MNLMETAAMRMRIKRKGRWQEGKEKEGGLAKNGVLNEIINFFYIYIYILPLR
jgi:hypothetical protein